MVWLEGMRDTPERALEFLLHRDNLKVRNLSDTDPT